ncbi:MAG: uncharacterized protein A8A55_0320 [Amphiamblys sp. WSBS2006]|nr:MAG: uncharacterized protein A8A55_0320 [Amphiamblys sp. WSBS2006]
MVTALLLLAAGVWAFEPCVTRSSTITQHVGVTEKTHTTMTFTELLYIKTTITKEAPRIIQRISVASTLTTLSKTTTTYTFYRTPDQTVTNIKTNTFTEFVLFQKIYTRTLSTTTTIDLFRETVVSYTTTTRLDPAPYVLTHIEKTTVTV